jgi:manganese oxidase
MDGVPGLSQPAVKPGAIFTYEFIASHADTFMHHPHANSAQQIDNGLYGLFIIDPQTPDPTRFDREFSLMLGAWQVTPPMGGPSGMPGMPGPGGPGSKSREMDAATSEHLRLMQELAAADTADERVRGMAQMMGVSPEQVVDMLKGLLAMASMPGGMGHMMGMMSGMSGMSGAHSPSWQGGMGGMNMSYNYFTVNGKAFPAVEPWIVKQGDLVRVRLVNISNLNHPMHLHGHDFKVIAKDGEPLRAEEQQVANTLSIDPGETYDIVFQANNPGLWALYCHELHHTENDGVEPGGLMQLIRYEGYQPPASAVETASPEAATPSTAMPMDAMPGHMPGMGH